MSEAQRLTSEEERQLKIVFAPLRPDLIFQRQVFKGEAYYVIKDPLALTYFRLQPEEAYLLQLIDGKRTLKEIVDAFSREYPNTERTPQEIAGFCNQLARSGLLNIPARAFVDFARQKPKGMNSLFMIWVKLISKILFFKVPLLDPSPWLGKMVHAIRFAWNPYFVWSCVAFYLFTGGWVWWHWSDISAYTSSTTFLSPQSFALIWVATIFIKTCHEFGHATTCRRFGGEVHEMGVCCICMMPCGYVDASDGWMMKKKSHKVYTTIAGIFTELMLASIATYAWFYLSPGLMKELMFRAMLIASVNTIFFNMNPLMKFDGYYVLSDLLEIPNLRTKAITYCSYHLQRILFGYRNTQQERLLEGESRRYVFIGYALAAYFFMASVIYGLSQIFARLLEKYELKEFGLIVGVAAQVSFLVSPILKIVYDAFRPGTHIVLIEPVWKRLTKWGIGLAVIVLVMFVFPVHFKVEAQGMIVPEAYRVITTPTPGFLEEVMVQTGDRVEKGQVLGRLQNISILTDAKVAQSEAHLAKLDLAQAEYAPEKAREATAALGLEAAELRKEEAQRKLAELTLVSPLDGVVVTPDIARMKGVFFAAEAPIFEVADLSKVHLLIPITEEQVSMLVLGGAIKGRLEATGRQIDTSVSFIASQKALPEEYRHAMIEAFGGPIKLQSAAVGGEGRIGAFFAEAHLDDTKNLQPFMRVQSVITGQKTTVAMKLWRKFLNFWNLRGPVKNPFAQ